MAKVAKKIKKPTVRVTKPKTDTSSLSVKPLLFRGAESRHLGDEPTWDKPIQNRTIALSRACTWYNYYLSSKEAKPMFLQWLETVKRKDDAKSIRGISDSEFNLTMCWLARMSLMGLQLLDTETERLEAEVIRLKSLKTVVEDDLPKEKKPSIQDHLRNKALDIANEIDGAYDDFVKSGLKTIQTSPLDIMRSQNLAQNQVSVIQDIWTKNLAELKLAQTDKEVAEYYDKYSKIQLRNLVKFAETVLSDCASYLAVKKVEKKPRAKKVKSPEQLTRTFKYLKEFAELKMKSEPPSKLVAATEAWLYDTAKRKLIHVVADSAAGSITVKGTTIVGFSERDTVMKTLRKPAEQLKEIFAGGKPANRKAFKEVKATEARWSGRSNESIIILKVW